MLGEVGPEARPGASSAGAAPLAWRRDKTEVGQTSGIFFLSFTSDHEARSWGSVSGAGDFDTVPHLGFPTRLEAVSACKVNRQDPR